MIANRNLYLAEDGATVVEMDDPRQRTLLVHKGCFINDADAARYGISDTVNTPTTSEPPTDDPAAPDAPVDPAAPAVVVVADPAVVTTDPAPQTDPDASAPVSTPDVPTVAPGKAAK